MTAVTTGAASLGDPKGMLTQLLTLALVVNTPPSIAYAADPEDGGHVFVTREGTSPLDLGPGHSPVWSPDGTSLAYLRCKGPKTEEHTVMIWSPGKAEPRAIYDKASSELVPVWSSDSKALLIGVNPKPVDDEEFGEFGAFDAAFVDTASGKSVGLGEIYLDEDTPAVAVPNSSNFILSYDTGDEEENPRLWLVDSSGKKLKNLGEGFSPEISPDGKYAAVFDGSNVVSIDLVTGARHKLAHCCDWESSWPVWLPDSTGVFVYDGAEEAIALVSPTGTRREQLPKGYQSVDLDPAGKVAVLGGDSSACVYDIAAGKTLAKIDDYYYSIGWAADGKRFFYVSSADVDEDEDDKLVVYDLVEGLPAFPAMPHSYMAEVSPDGKWLLVPSETKTSIYEIATGKWRDLATKTYATLAVCPK